ncbi:MAG: hypothetical protein AUJ55_00135 [Proteobacteria bacterium CG1_02_64_396]|nr:MAG: hypothetical protein AUJ55_00135 [Proteobacteria bacterium CG1_02_64_396]
MNHELLQLGRFSLVGVASTLIHLSIVVALVEWSGMDPVPANVIAYACAVLFGFVHNYRWTFRSTAPPLHAFLRFALVGGVGLGNNWLLMTLAVHHWGWHYLLGLALVVAINTPLTFWINRHWSFRSAPPPQSE